MSDDTPTTDHADALREVQGWMALDLHQALGHPVNPTATNQGHPSWGDWWASLVADVRRTAPPAARPGTCGHRSAEGHPCGQPPGHLGFHRIVRCDGHDWTSWVGEPPTSAKEQRP
jgi:hypothetical protein